MPLDWNILQPKHYYITKSWNLNVETVIFLWYITIKWLWIGAGHRYTYTIMWGDLWKKKPPFCSFCFLPVPSLWGDQFLISFLSEGKAEQGRGVGKSRQDPHPHPIAVTCSHSDCPMDKGKTNGRHWYRADSSNYRLGLSSSNRKGFGTNLCVW